MIAAGPVGWKDGSKPMLTLVDQPVDIELDWVSGERDQKAMHRQAMALLSAIVSQARLDGMSEIRFKANQDEQRLVMQYFGPHADPNPQWWDMVPPPFECYPHLVLSVLSSADSDEGLPLRGQVPAKLHGRSVTVRFALPAVEELALKIDD